MFAIDGYKTIDVCFEPDRAIVTTILEPIQEMLCHRCEHPLDSALSRYHLRIKDLPIMTYENFISFFRRKGFCPICKKVRAEKVHFLSDETPHLTKQYTWWLGKITEVTNVAQAGGLTGVDKSTLWRIDHSKLGT